MSAPEALVRRPGPFLLATSDAWLTEEELALLRSWFHVERRPFDDWIRHTGVFYRCDIGVVDPAVAPGLRARWRRAVAEALGLDLLDTVQLTAQRMGAGDGSDVHTDHPAAGFEAARLVVQLDELSPADGGAFRAFDEAGRCWLERVPAPGAAAAFEMSPRSHHDVTACARERRAVVAHFWHRANPPDLGERLAQRFAGMGFADLPASLDGRMMAAESRYDDEHTWRAAAAAWWAATAGHPEAVVAVVYEAALGGPGGGPVAAEALWWVDLWRDGFDRSRWSEGAPWPENP